MASSPKIPKEPDDVQLWKRESYNPKTIGETLNFEKFGKNNFIASDSGL